MKSFLIGGRRLCLYGKLIKCVIKFLFLYDIGVPKIIWMSMDVLPNPKFPFFVKGKVNKGKCFTYQTLIS